MSEEDKHKTAFIIERGTYCYKVMPFGLKNTGATYQGMATTLFHDQMYKLVEVYVDDMMIKSETREGHLLALEKFLHRVGKYNLKLNLKKYVFDVTSGTLLGHTLGARGIEVDPEKKKSKPSPKCPHLKQWRRSGHYWER